MLRSFRNIRSIKTLLMQYDEGFLRKSAPEAIPPTPAYPIPTHLHLFDFIDSDGHTGNLEVNFMVANGELVHSRIAIYFSEFSERDEFLTDQVLPFFDNTFQPVQSRKYSNLPVHEFSYSELSVGLNPGSDYPLISTYITLKGYQ